MKKEFKLSIRVSKPNLSSEKENYEYWRKCMKDTNANFYILSNDLVKYLPVLKSGAMNLYLYYCFSANNKTGENWKSTDTIARELETTTRSINNWNNDLKQLGLISRKSKNKSSKTTFLLPISNFFVDYSNRISPKEYLEKYDKELDGTPYSIYHIFQWRKNSKTNNYDKPQSYIVITFIREYTKEFHTFYIKKFCLFTSKSINNFTPKKIETHDDIYLFDSPHEINKSLVTKGIAISSKFDFIGNQQETLTILNELSSKNDDLTEQNFKKEVIK